MRSIKRSYLKAQNRNPNIGTYVCLASVVKHRKFSRKALVKAFNELMPEEEYSNDETKELVDYLEYLTKLPVEGEK
mgnify:CR=1 FL=1